VDLPRVGSDHFAPGDFGDTDRDLRLSSGCCPGDENGKHERREKGRATETSTRPDCEKHPLDKQG
jgi:hypothetical protein